MYSPFPPGYHGAKGIGIGKNFINILFSLHIVGPCFQDVHHDGVLVMPFCVYNQHALLSKLQETLREFPDSRRIYRNSGAYRRLCGSCYPSWPLQSAPLRRDHHSLHRQRIHSFPVPAVGSLFNHPYIVIGHWRPLPLLWHPSALNWQQGLRSRPL